VCIIAISPLGEKFAREVFNRMWEANPHGLGMVFSTRGGLGVVKGLMDPEEAWEEYQALPDGVPHILHFRFATHGGIRRELTHPFVVHERSPIVIRGEVEEPALVHNGVWHLYHFHEREVDLEDPVSDSRVLAAFTGLVGVKEALQKHLREMESAGRVAILTPDRKLHLVGTWVRDGNFLYSNSGYKVATRWWKGWENVAKK